jgi:hypothetical protein
MYSLDALTNNAVRLTPEEQDQLFTMLTENAQLINKLVPGMPLIEYIVTGTKRTSNPLFYAYETWKITKNNS